MPLASRKLIVALVAGIIAIPASSTALFLAANEAEAGESVAVLPTDQLTEANRLLLRKYTRARSCPLSLKNSSVPGFYELCLSIVGRSASRDPVTGLVNDNVYIRGQRRATAPKLKGFKLRLQMMQEALDPTTRREDGTGPARPTRCGNNPDCLVPRGS